MEGRAIPVTQYRWIYPQDTSQQFTVFKAINASGKLVARPHLADLACEWCGRVDETKALQRPIEVGTRIRLKRDLIGSFDLQPLISLRMEAALTELAPGAIDTYPIIDNVGYRAVAPKRILTPSPSDPAFRFTDRCGRCSRFRDIVCKGAPAVEPDLEFAAFNLETRVGRFLAWFASLDLVTRLQSIKPTLKGVYFDPDVFAARP